MPSVTDIRPPVSNRLRELFFSFLLWRERHIKEKTFVLVLAFFVGILSGVAAIVL